jgi:DHA3 family macrolide efflux protein-like MFS transporter
VEAASDRWSGMRAFSVVWFGQLVSLLGTGMTSFALSVWGWQETGSATAMSLMLFFAIGPAIVLGPVASAIVDRGSRKWLIILADVGAALATAAVLLLFSMGHLQVWHLYAANLLAGICQAFQGPAFSASVTVMVAKEQYGRANGMMTLVHYIPEVVAPLSAAFVVRAAGIGRIMMIDLLTFGSAVVMTLLVAIPQPGTSAEGRAARGSLWSESVYGFHYMLMRPGSLGLQPVFLVVDFAGVFQWALQSPMILARTGQDSRALGTVLSAAGIGSVLGGLVMSAWGGPKRRIHGVLAGMGLECLLGITLMGLARTLPVWALAGFLTMLFVPVLNGSNQAIWQAKVAPDLQGKVFAARRVIAQFSYLVGFVAAGPLADHLFEPGMQPGSALTGVFAGWVGTDPGAGMALLMAIWGLVGASACVVAYLLPVVRGVEVVIPDHDSAPALATSQPA